MATEIAGLPVAREPDGMVLADAAVAVIRGVDSGGRTRYYMLQTANVHDVEAVGMHETASHLHKQRTGGQQ